MIKGIIYMYESPSGKKYIGQTINEISRKCRFRDLTKCYAGGGKLENARKKYGPGKLKKAYGFIWKYKFN